MIRPARLIRPVLIAFALALPLHRAAAAEPFSLQGRHFTEVRSLSELPQHIRSRLHADGEARTGIADIGKPFNTGDVIIQGWPDRGLVGAGRDGDTWVVAIAENHNWGGVAVLAYVFEGTAMARQERLGFWGVADAFARIVAALSAPPRPPAQLGGVFIGDSQRQVEVVLGKPAEIVSHKQTYIGDPANEPPDLMITKELRYPGLSIWLRDTNGVMQITGTGGSYCQSGKICLGATAAAVDDELRNAGIGGFVPNTNIYGLRHETGNCQADVGFTSGTVSTIKVFCW